jgi:hypothetical protein
MVFGVHFAPVRSEVVAPVTKNTLFLSRTISLTASATEEVGTSTITSTSPIGRLGSSAFRLSISTVSTSLAGSCFSPESAHRPFHHGIRR